MTYYALFYDSFKSHDESCKCMCKSEYFHTSDDKNHTYFIDVTNFEKLGQYPFYIYRYLTQITLNDDFKLESRQNTLMSAPVQMVKYGQTYDLAKPETHVMLHQQGFNDVVTSIRLMTRWKGTDMGCDAWRYVNLRRQDTLRELITYCITKNMADIIMFISNHAHTSILDTESNTHYICTAIEKSNNDILECLMKYDYNPSVCLDAACRNGNINLVKTFIGAGGQHDIDTLIQVSKDGDFDIAIVLIEHNPNVYDDCVLINAASKNNLEMIKFLGEKEFNLRVNDDEAMRLAAGKGYLEIVKYLVNAGANIYTANDDAFKRAFLKVHTPARKNVIKRYILSHF